MQDAADLAGGAIIAGAGAREINRNLQALADQVRPEAK
jgi:hypothetical protein